MKTPSARKLPLHAEQPEALRKALEKARDEKARMLAKETVDPLTAENKKAFKKDHVGRTRRQAPVY